MPRLGLRGALTRRICAASLLLLAGACAAPDLSAIARANPESWGRQDGFAAARLSAGDFQLLAFARHSTPADSLTVYVEGDGAPWATPHHPPRDPTPRQPLALALARADNARSVAWLARPCQYLSPGALLECDKAYWTARRFAPEVIASFDHALTQLKAASGARSLRLVGYSGGGVIAVLLGMRRSDVRQVLTVAAPLSLGEWIAWHELSPMAQSSDPMHQERSMAAAHSVHFAGAQDRIVPPAIIERYVRSHGGRLEAVAGFDHDCCWVRDWQRLLARARELEAAP